MYVVIYILSSYAHQATKWSCVFHQKKGFFFLVLFPSVIISSCILKFRYSSFLRKSVAFGHPLSLVDRFTVSGSGEKTQEKYQASVL
jgi:hypothetical protein